MPNWYLTKKLKDLAKPAILMAPLGLGLSGDNIPTQETTSPVIQTQPTTKPSQPASQPTTQPIAKPVQKAPATKPAENQTVSIDVKKIIQIESSGKANAQNASGAAGLMQVMPATWEDIANKIGKYQGFNKYKYNEKANVEIGSYYMNTEIPRLLKAFKLPDSVEMRLAAYNWGIGNVKKAYEAYGKDWVLQLPQETANYIKKYRG